MTNAKSCPNTVKAIFSCLPTSSMLLLTWENFKLTWENYELSSDIFTATYSFIRFSDASIAAVISARICFPSAATVIWTTSRMR